jgi:hypothetical protein
MMSDGRQIWHKYIVTMVETDSSGKATFTGVSAGTYWLYAIKKRPRGQYLLWNIETTVDLFDTKNVTLSNENISFTSGENVPVATPQK